MTSVKKLLQLMLYNINDVLNAYGFSLHVQFYSIEQQIITIPAAVSATSVQAFLLGYTI